MFVLLLTMLNSNFYHCKSILVTIHSIGDTYHILAGYVGRWPPPLFLLPPTNHWLVHCSPNEHNFAEQSIYIRDMGGDAKVK